MPDLLLELLTEEIPARMQARAAEELRRHFTEWLTAARLSFSEARSFVTPRRLTLAVEGLPAAQPEVSEERRGPRVGAPQNAIEGFLKSAGLTSLDQCEQRDTGKGVFYFANIRRTGQPTASVLPDFVRSLLLGFEWPKSMRFPSAKFRWVRPITSILCIFDGKALSFEVDGIPVGDTTRGHRFLSPAEFKVKHFADYEKKLRTAHVILDPAERRAAIAEGLAKAAASARLTLKDDPALLDEVTGLVEWPVVFAGSIDPAYMTLPPEVLTTSMRAHQKYFACLDAKGELAPRFLIVSNMVTKDGGKAVVAGNERVLRARLADARFFWEQDRRKPLSFWAKQLSQRTFFVGLGDMSIKSNRISSLAMFLAQNAINGGNYADVQRASAAALLAKADLSTGMVGEFPELQGIIGRYYAIGEGKPIEVANAIGEHYSPIGRNDRCPSAPLSVCVALADRFDSLVGFFGIGERPSGSKDPLALRRAALGVIRLIIENQLRVNLSKSILKAYERYSGVVWIHGRDEVAADLLAFFADRLKVHLREKGVRHDLITAVFALAGEDDLVRLLARVAALARFLGTDDGGNLLVAYRRAANIVRIEEKKDKRAYDGPADRKLLQMPEEKALAERLGLAAEKASAALKREAFDDAMAALATLRGSVDEFFDRVTVNCEDRELRANRLRLLSEIRATLNAVADFSEIEG